MSSVESEIGEVSPRLRKRFLIWSLAVASSLSSTGLVALAPSPAWAQEDRTGEKATKEKPPSPDESAEKTEDEDKPFDRKEFSRLLKENDLGKLSKRLDAAIEADPGNMDLLQMNTTVGMMQIRSAPKAGIARLGANFERLVQAETLNAAGLSALSMTTTYLVRSDKELEVDQQIAILDQAIEQTKTRSEADPAGALRSLVMTKSQILVSEDRTADAKEMLDEMLAESRSAMAEDTSEDEAAKARAAFVALASTYSSALGSEYPDDAAEVLSEAQSLVLSSLDGEQATASDFVQLYGLQSSAISRLLYSEPSEAVELLDTLEGKLDEVKERFSEGEYRSLKRYEGSISSLRKRLDSALKRAELIGTVAPEIDADAFVAMEPVSMDDLKGKVVLVDFWAVWCGPCIATFPHLIEWHEEFSDKGLVILGATKYYGYEWDEEIGKASKGDEVARDVELAMLEKFRESHGLQHGFFVAGKDSDYSKQFQVSGIPQAVLIDKEGKIAMIKVGSGDANAKALHSKIAELLE